MKTRNVMITWAWPLCLCCYVHGFLARGKRLKHWRLRLLLFVTLCKDRIEKGLAYEKRGEKIRTGRENKDTHDHYDPGKTSPDELRKAVSKLGYIADNLPADKAAYAKLPACPVKKKKILLKNDLGWFMRKIWTAAGLLPAAVSGLPIQLRFTFTVAFLTGLGCFSQFFSQPSLPEPGIQIPILAWAEARRARVHGMENSLHNWIPLVAESMDKVRPMLHPDSRFQILTLLRPFSRRFWSTLPDASRSSTVERVNGSTFFSPGSREGSCLCSVAAENRKSSV